MKEKTLEHLEELLELKSEKIEKLEADSRSLRAELASSAWGWQVPQPVTETSLPLPRVELLARPASFGCGYESGTLWVLRLVVADITSDALGIPIAAASIRRLDSTIPDPDDHAHLPTAAFGNALFLSGHLGIPAYAVVLQEASDGTVTSRASFLRPNKSVGLHFDRGIKARRHYQPKR